MGSGIKIIFFCITVTGTIYALSIRVDHNSIPEFNQIPEAYKTAAAGLRMIFMDRSSNTLN